jgi:hypothetical protein
MQQTDRSFFLLLLCVGTLLSDVAQAAAVFNNREQWEAAAGAPITTIDFTTRDDGTPISADYFEATRLTLNGVTFTPTSGTFRIQSHSLTFGAQRPLRAMLPVNTTAVGMTLSSGARNSGPYKIALSTGEAYTVDLHPDGTSQIFLGITSTTPFEWISLYQYVNSTKLDNFTFVARPVSNQPSSEMPTPLQTARSDIQR